jgi:hypothetical protein
MLKKPKSKLLLNGFKSPDHARGQGMRQFKSGAYTPVGEHFGLTHNAAPEH